MSLRIPVVQSIDCGYGVAAFKLPKWAIEVWDDMQQKYKTKNFQIHILRPFRPRSSGKRSQNNCEHGWISHICQFTGHDFRDLELYLLRRAFRRGYPPERNYKGEIVYSLNDSQAIPKPFKDASVEEANLALAEIEETAAEFDIVLPRYDEKGNLVFA